MSLQNFSIRNLSPSDRIKISSKILWKLPLTTLLSSSPLIDFISFAFRRQINKKWFRSLERGESGERKLSRLRTSFRRQQKHFNEIADEKRAQSLSSKQQNPIARCNPLHIFSIQIFPLWRDPEEGVQSKQRQEDLIFWPDLILNRCYWINLCDAWRSLFPFMPQPASGAEGKREARKRI